MIPKIIHYSWVGTEIPNNVKLRINEWKRTLPDWKFMFWNENNYDFNQFWFTQKKMRDKDWGYATDELRYDVINKYGGFYLDTDMIIKKDLSPLLNENMVWGFMYDNSLLTSFFGAAPNQPFLDVILSEYSDHKNNEDLFRMTSNPFVTNIFLKKISSFESNGKMQNLNFENKGIKVFPRDYFCYPTRNRKANYTEHLFDNSWGTSNKGVYGVVKHEMRKLFPILYGNIANRRGVNYSKQFISEVHK